MKKTSLFVAALIAASGASFAADSSTSAAGTSMNSDTSATSAQSGDTLGAKTRRGVHKVGEAIKETGREVAAAAHRVTHPREGRQAGTSYGGASNDMRSTTDTTSDSGRQQRMDSAYADWQNKRNKS